MPTNMHIFVRLLWRPEDAYSFRPPAPVHDAGDIPAETYASTVIVAGALGLRTPDASEYHAALNISEYF